VENFANGGAYMVEFSVGENSPIIGKSLIEIATYGNKVLFAMVERGNEVIIPRGDFIVNKDDVLHVVATEEELASFCKKIKIFKSRSRSAFVVGGGRISYYLANQLSSSGTSVKIMEIDKEKCKELSSVLTSVDVICADATEQAILDEENLKNYDACVLLTGLDETNVILSLYAIQQGVCKVIAKVGRDNVIGMVEKLGLDSVVSPKSVIANHIMRFVRMQQAEKGETINNLYRLKDKAEAMEFTVADSFKYQSTKLRELKVAPYAIIGGVVRDREFILPTGDTELFAGDRVIVVTTKQIKEFAEIFR
jgi:trk system potassium uptake protein TrkA